MCFFFIIFWLDLFYTNESKFIWNETSKGAKEYYIGGKRILVHDKKGMTKKLKKKAQKVLEANTTGMDRLEML